MRQHEIEKCNDQVEEIIEQETIANNEEVLHTKYLKGKLLGKGRFNVI
jgi:hypothetical protein